LDFEFQKFSYYKKTETKEWIMKLGIKELLVDELKDMLSAEEQIVVALPKMVKAAESPELKKAFTSHLKETKGQIVRLEKIFKLLKIVEKEKFCKATHGLIQECTEVLKKFDKSPIRDAALISKAQRIEHYEISAYGTLRTFAKELKLNEVATLLQGNLDEEGGADKKLTKLAEGGLFSSGINHKAACLSNGTKAIGIKANGTKANGTKAHGTKTIGIKANGTKAKSSIRAKSPTRSIKAKSAIKVKTPIRAKASLRARASVSPFAIKAKTLTKPKKTHKLSIHKKAKRALAKRG
jgi:ferritin-like metal-binding protein YciE